MPDSYFESMYASDPDPWGFEHTFYERRKYALTLAALGRERYGTVFEPGCANGVLSADLATRCDLLIAYDIVPAAVQRAQVRLEAVEHATVGYGRMPDDWPSGPLDLVVWSEIAYYLAPSGLDHALDRLADRLRPGGELVIVNYTGETNYPQTADEVHQHVSARRGLVSRCALRDESFRLDTWVST